MKNTKLCNYFFAAFLLAVCGVYSFAVSDSKQLHAQGVEFYKAGKYIEAMDYFMSVLIDDPENEDAKLLIKKSADAICERERKKIEKHRAIMVNRAWRFLEEQSEKYDLESLYVDGRRDYKKKRFLFAMEKFEKIIAVAPGYKETGDYVDVIITKMNKCAKLSNEFAMDKVSYAVGFINWRDKKYQKAINEWQKYLNYRPDDPEILFYEKAAKDILASGEELARQKELEKKVAKIFKKGEKFFRRSKYVSAIRDWERVIKIANEGALFTAAKWEEKSKTNINEALRKLRDAAKKTAEKAKKKDVEKKKLVIDPAGAKEHYVKGLVSYGQGRIAAAIREWEFAVRLDPNNEKARNALSKAKKELEAK